MKVILAGCEYSGTTTLSHAISDWMVEVFGGEPWGPPHYGWHDHYVLPNVTHHDMSEEEQQQMLTRTPRLKEVYQRYNLAYHTPDQGTGDSPILLIGFQIAEAVYAPLYYGYGGQGEFADRRKLSFSIEHTIMEHAPDTVVVLVKAAPEIIAKRMKEAPHHNGVLQEKDIAHVLERFEEEYGAAILRRRFTLDTSEQTVEETLQEFVRQIEGHLSPADRRQMLVHKEWDTIGSIR